MISSRIKIKFNDIVFLSGICISVLIISVFTMSYFYCFLDMCTCLLVVC